MEARDGKNGAAPSEQGSGVAARPAGTAFYNPRRALAFASLVPVAVAVGAYFLAPIFARDEAGIPALQLGGALGALLGLIVALALGLWTWASCKRPGSAFLAPVAMGFLAKAITLAAGTFLLWRTVGQGSHLAYAFAFVAAAFGWSLVFTPSLLRQSPSESQPATG